MGIEKLKQQERKACALEKFQFGNVMNSRFILSADRYFGRYF